MIQLPYKLQDEIEKDEHRFRVVACGRRWGKSNCAMREVYNITQTGWLKTKRKQRGWVVAPTIPLVRESWLTAEEVLGDLIKKKRENPIMMMDFGTKGFVEFKSADRDDEGLRGAGLDFVIIDEASRVSRKAWEEGIRPALGDREGRAIFISTPKGKNWFYEMWLRGQGEDEEIKSWQYATYTNPYFPKKEWKKIEATTSEQVLKQEYLADFLEDTGRVFPYLDRVYRGELERGLLGEEYTMGVDLGKSEDFTVLTVIKHSTLQLVHIYRINKIDWRIQKKYIVDIAKVYNDAITYIDSTGLGDPIEEDLRDAGVNTRDYKFGNKSKEELIEQLKVAIEQGLIGIPICPETEFLINELKSFSYEVNEKTRRTTYQAPVGLHDDGVISLGLAVRGLQYQLYQKQKKETPEIPFRSAKWLEIERYNQEYKHNARLPRRIRSRILEPVFGW